MSERLTAHQIIDETVAFYGADSKGRRAVIFGTRACQYVTNYREPEQRSCAVGRCLLSEVLPAVENCGEAVEDLVVLCRATLPDAETLDDLLQPQYRGHDCCFWTDLQELHDTAEHWTGDSENPLTEVGQRYVEDLKVAYQ